MSALYRRYRGKDDLLRELARDGLAAYIRELEAALANSGGPWTVYAECLGRILDGGSQALAQRLAGTFIPTQDLAELAQRAATLAEQVHQKAQRAKVLRKDVSSSDIVLLLEAMSTITLPGLDAGPGQRRRYLALVLQALRAPGGGHLPGRPASPSGTAGRWRRGPGPAERAEAGRPRAVAPGLTGTGPQGAR